MSHENSQSIRKEKLWMDFLQAIRNGDENKVTRILIESVSPVRGRPNPFLTRQIPTTEVSIFVGTKLVDLKHPLGGGDGGSSKPLPFENIPFLTEKVTLSYTFHRKWYPFHIPTEETLHLFTIPFHIPIESV